jgi:hypothetical protein
VQERRRLLLLLLLLLLLALAAMPVDGLHYQAPDACSQ